MEFGGVPFRFEAARPCDMPEELVPLGKKKAARAKKEPSAVPALFFLNVFQLLAALSLLVHYAENIPLALPLCFLGLIAVEWVYFGVQRLRGIGVEILAFFLATVGCAWRRAPSPRPSSSSSPPFCWGWRCSGCSAFS